jgi:alkylated DNA repair dioxygenase AlkB
MSALPDGFLLRHDFVTETEEAELLPFLSTLQMGEVRMHGVTAKRRVRQFGHHYSFESFRLSPAQAIPSEMLAVRARVAGFANMDPEQFSEALVTFYPAGAAIGWHRDAPAFGIVAGLSLGASCRMRFGKGSGAARVTTAVELPPRSVYVLAGPARKEWQHAITAVKASRWSITFRTVRRSPR